MNVFYHHYSVSICASMTYRKTTPNGVHIKKTTLRKTNSREKEVNKTFLIRCVIRGALTLLQLAAVRQQEGVQLILTHHEHHVHVKLQCNNRLRITYDYELFSKTRWIILSNRTTNNTISLVAFSIKTLYQI